MEFPGAPLSLLAALVITSCATARPAGESENDEDADTGPSITSSSVRIERGRKGPATAVIDRGSEVGEVMRVMELLAQKGTRRVKLKIENGAEAEVTTGLPDGTGHWLVVAVTEAGFRLSVSTANEIAMHKAELGKLAAGSDVPYRDGQPDWERLTNLSRALTQKLGKLGGASVAASARAPADRAVETLQQLRFALPEAQRRTLVAW